MSRQHEEMNTGGRNTYFDEGIQGHSHTSQDQRILYVRWKWLRKHASSPLEDQKNLCANSSGKEPSMLPHTDSFSINNILLMKDQQIFINWIPWIIDVLV